MKRYTARPATAVRAEHAEGPAWDARSGQLAWVDQFAGLVHLADHATDTCQLQVRRTYEVGRPLGAVVPTADDDGGWMLAGGAGFAHLAADGTVTVVGEPESVNAAAMRMNDGKCDPAGRFWAGSMAWSKTPGAGTLYRLDRDLSVSAVLTGLTISNGLAWPPDGSSVYFIDTPTQRVDRFTVGADGMLADRRPVVHVDPDQGAPDGMAIDDEGCLWVALWGGWAVRRYSPHGEVLAHVEVDAPQVSSCAFGGAAGHTLFITTSQEGYRREESDRFGEAGRLFCVDVDVTGPFAAPFRGPTAPAAPR